MANDERNDINSIMGRLLKKQQELAARRTEEPGDEAAKAGAQENNAAAPVEESGFSAAEEDTSAMAAETAAAEETPAAAPVRSNPDEVYADIINEVMASSPEEDEMELARKVQDVYNNYVRTGSIQYDLSEEKEPEPAAEEEAAAAQSEGVFYTSPEDDVPAPETETPAPQSPLDVASLAAMAAEAESGEDDLLMAALGYTDAETVPASAAAEKKTVPQKENADLGQAFAYHGKEYKKRADRGVILGQYDSERRYMMIRLLGTGVFALLALLFDLFGKKFGGPFSAVNYPVVNVMASLQLLVLCAAFSHRQLWKGLRGLISVRPVPASVTVSVVILTVLYDAVVAVALAVNPQAGFTLYASPAALSLLILCAEDDLRLRTETGNFEKLSSFERMCSLEKEEDAVYRLRKGTFAEGFFRRTNRYNGAYGMLNYVLAPVAAVAVIVFIWNVAAGKAVTEAAGSFIVTLQLAMPVFAVLAMDLPFFLLNIEKKDWPAVILHECDTAEYGEVEKIILDETDMFGPSALTVDRYTLEGEDSNLFNDISAASAICDKVGGTISGAIRALAEGTSLSDEVGEIDLLKVTEGGIVATAGGRRYVLGSARFLNSNGIACRDCDDSVYEEHNPGGAVFHIAVEKTEILRIRLRYTADAVFSSTVRTLSESGIETELRCLDPNLSQEFVANVIGDPGVRITVRRVEKETVSTETVLESGLIADAEESLSVIAVADMCRGYRKVARWNRTVLAALEAVLLCVSAVLGILGLFGGISPLWILIVNLAALLPTFAVAKFV